MESLFKIVKWKSSFFVKFFRKEDQQSYYSNQFHENLGITQGIQGLFHYYNSDKEYNYYGKKRNYSRKGGKGYRWWEDDESSSEEY